MAELAPDLVSDPAAETDPNTMPPTMFVLNPDDHVDLARRLTALEGSGRLIVRPTPGGTIGDLALDVLSAAGISPASAQSEPMSLSRAFAAAAAWLRADDVRTIVIDRAHLLRAAAFDRLRQLAHNADADLILIWSAEPGPRLDTARARFETSEPISVPDFHQRLPLPPPALVFPPGLGGFPSRHLPLVDYPWFLATARRRLHPDLFACVRKVFNGQREDTLAWLQFQLGEHRGPDAHRRLRTDMISYLRDERLGPAPNDQVALIRLRAIQVTFLTGGWSLRWEPASLGPEPAARLPSLLTDRVARRLRTEASPQAAAATALSLHFCTGTRNFGFIRCGHLSPDGRFLHVPPAPGDVNHHQIHHFESAPWVNERGIPGYVDRRATPHLASHTPIAMPSAAAPLLAAHLAHRRAASARDDDPYFPRHDRDGREVDPERMLREAVMRTCHRLKLSPAWLHRSHCRHGDQIGAHADERDWLSVRALTLHQLPAHRPLHPAG